MKNAMLLVVAILCAGCASSETYEESPQPVNRPARPAPKNSYGAIAASKVNLATGYAINQDSPQQAEQLAMNECLKNSEGQPCQVRVHIRNACGAIADATNMHAGYAWGTTQQRAEAEAMRNCNKFGQNCAVSASFCSQQRPALREDLYR